MGVCGGGVSLPEGPHPRWRWLCPQERLPTVPLSGMFNKSGGKVRLTFKLEQDQLWIGTKGGPERRQQRRRRRSDRRSRSLTSAFLLLLPREDGEGTHGLHQERGFRAHRGPRGLSHDGNCFRFLTRSSDRLLILILILIRLLLRPQAFQLGPTEASQYWVYWVPAQFVDAIKDTVLGKWQYF